MFQGMEQLFFEIVRDGGCTRVCVSEGVGVLGVFFSLSLSVSRVTPGGVTSLDIGLVFFVKYDLSVFLVSEHHSLR